MIILAILQNQWFKNPEPVKEMYARKPEYRNRYIQAFLFMGCLTGRRLKQVFGEQLCDEIIWEEASLEVGGQAYSQFPADLDHLARTIIEKKPDIILAFGKIASDGLLKLAMGKEGFTLATALNEDRTITNGEFIIEVGEVCCRLIVGPHPAARSDPMPRLREIADRLAFLIHDHQVQTL